MFRTLIYQSSGAYDYSVELPLWSCVLGSMCVGVSVWLEKRGFETCRNHVSLISFVIPVVFNKLIRVKCMYLSNKTSFDGRGIYSIYCIRYNYVFLRWTMAIFRLYMKYLVSSYTRLIMGYMQWGGRRWGGHEILLCHGVWEVWVHGVSAVICISRTHKIWHHKPKYY